MKNKVTLYYRVYRWAALIFCIGSAIGVSSALFVDHITTVNIGVINIYILMGGIAIAVIVEIIQRLSEKSKRENK